MRLLITVALALIVVILARWLLGPTTKWRANFAIAGMIVGLIGGLLVLQMLADNHHIAAGDRANSANLPGDGSFREV